ncbi:MULTISPECIES: hypothetical protein [unclassified Wolbachia]|nr:hypothetical protein [Wolbachia endosymbiont of Brugia malayi]
MVYRVNTAEHKATVVSVGHRQGIYK